jgi:hypothetical protein
MLKAARTAKSILVVRFWDFMVEASVWRNMVNNASKTNHFSGLF